MGAHANFNLLLKQQLIKDYRNMFRKKSGYMYNAVRFKPFIILCLESIGIECVISESCY